MRRKRTAGALIRARRQQLGLTLKSLGDAVGVSLQHVSEIEAGSRALTAALATKLSRRLDSREILVVAVIDLLSADFPALDAQTLAFCAGGIATSLWQEVTRG